MKRGKFLLIGEDIPIHSKSFDLANGTEERKYISSQYRVRIPLKLAYTSEFRHGQSLNISRHRTREIYYMFTVEYKNLNIT